MNEEHLRAAFPIPAEPPTLDAKIDHALAGHTTARPVARRFALGFALTAAVAVALVAVPARRAEASLVSILSALESSVHVRMVQYTVDEDGHPTPYRTVDAAGEDYHAYGKDGASDRYDVGKLSLTYDPLLKALVASPRDRAVASRTKIRFVPGKGIANGMATLVERVHSGGGDFLRATSTSPDARHRFVIDAALDTKRPFAARHEVSSGGGWRTVEATRFDYHAVFTVQPPAPTAIPRIDEAEADRRHAAGLSARTLAQLPLAKGRLVVRRVDVAGDGTVYVAFQRGARPEPWFEGYTFRLTDSLGTGYARLGQTLKQTFGRASSPDGPFEMEAFVPVELENGWRPRALRLQAHRFADLRWAGTLDRTRILPDGKAEPWPGILTAGADDRDPAPVDLPEMEFARPTCAGVPDWAGLFDPQGFGDASHADAEKADARARAQGLMKP